MKRLAHIAHCIGKHPATHHAHHLAYCVYYGIALIEERGVIHTAVISVIFLVTLLATITNEHV